MANIADVLNKKFNVGGGNIAEALFQALEALGSTEFINYQVVDSLPSSGEVGTIYFVSSNRTDNDRYDEYIWHNGRFEKIGGTTTLNPITTSEIDSWFD